MIALKPLYSHAEATPSGKLCVVAPVHCKLMSSSCVSMLNITLLGLTTQSALRLSTESAATVCSSLSWYSVAHLERLGCGGRCLE